MRGLRSGKSIGRSIVGVVALVGASLASIALVAGPAGAIAVNDEASFRTAFANASETSITLTANIVLTCPGGEANRNSGNDLTIEGNGFTISQTCAGASLLNVDGTGTLTINNATLTGAEAAVEADSAVILNGTNVTAMSSAAGDGAGIVSEKDVTLVDSVIDGVSGDAEAAGVRSGGAVSLTNSTITNVEAGDAAYGIVADGDITLTDSVVTGVSGSDETYGVYSDGGSAILTRSEVSDIADDDGDAGGVFADVDVSLTDSSISGIDGSADAYGTVNYTATVRGSRITDVHGYSFTAAIDTQLEVVMSDTLVQNVSSEVDAAFGVTSDEESVTVDRSTIANVTGANGAVGLAAYEAGTVRNSTITGVEGPALWVSDLTLVYSDIVGNGSDEFEGNKSVQTDGEVSALASGDDPAQVWADTVTVFGSVIVDANAGIANCSTGPVTSKGYNFADDTSCTLTATGDTQQVGANALLGSLADNGGPTPTFLPQTGSPLLDKIPAAACQTPPATGITTDQRGLPRPGFTNCDIGSVELQPLPPPPVIQPTFTG